MKPRPRALLVAACALLAGLVAAVFAACLPAYTFGQSPDGGTDAGTDATSDGAPLADATSDAPSSADGSGNPEASADAASDAPPPVDGGPRLDAQSTIAVVSVGSKAYAIGYGYQAHLVYAQNDGRYWLFYASNGTTSQISTLVSADLVTWTPAGSIALTSGYTVADGYSFSVTYANLGGDDVVHIVENSVSGGNYESFHIRATIASGAITGTIPVGLPDTQSGGAQGSSAGSCPNAGPTTAVGADGHVWDVTAWTGHQGATTCDTNIYESPGVDTGAGWNTGAFAHDGYYVSLPGYTWCHELVSLPDAGVVMIVYPDEDNVSSTLFDSIGWALSPSFDGGGPGSTGVDMPAADELFNGTNNQASLNDWTSCRLTDGNVHVMRHVITSPGTSSDTSVGPFEEEVYDGTSWSPTTPPPSVTSTTNTGLVLLSDANPDDGMLAAVIGTDNAIHIAKWTSAAGWVQLASLPGSTARNSLAGTGCGSKRPAIFWTEGAAAPYEIMAADLSGLL